MDALLQRMFEEDLDPEDFAETDEPETLTRSFPNPACGST